ncbi:MAG: acyloxyacyl hydrolase [Deltaproteobacteria bacterium]|nr:acyloxyacyl hydrolase [Deltaproteobacteria bacterium]
MRRGHVRLAAGVMVLMAGMGGGKGLAGPAEAGPGGDPVLVGQATPGAPGPGMTPVTVRPGTLRKGMTEWGVELGYGIVHDIPDESTDVDWVAVLPRWGYVFTDPVGPAFLRGNVYGMIEPILALTTRPFKGYIAGFTPVGRYIVETGSALRPFLSFGAGVLRTNLGTRIRELGSRYNFSLQGGLVVLWFTNGQTAINVEYRFHHISNAGTATPNRGLNASFLLVGVSTFLGQR